MFAVLSSLSLKFVELGLFFLLLLLFWFYGEGMFVSVFIFLKFLGIFSDVYDSSLKSYVLKFM